MSSTVGRGGGGRRIQALPPTATPPSIPAIELHILINIYIYNE